MAGSCENGDESCGPMKLRKYIN